MLDPTPTRKEWGWLALAELLHMKVCIPAGLTACLCGSYAREVGFLQEQVSSLLEGYNAVKEANVEAYSNGYYAGLRESGAAAQRERGDRLEAERDVALAARRPPLTVANVEAVLRAVPWTYKMEGPDYPAMARAIVEKVHGHAR